MNTGKMIPICLGLFVLSLIAVFVFNVSFGTLIFAGAFLLCPLMHVWMMKSGGHKH